MSRLSFLMLSFLFGAARKEEAPPVDDFSEPVRSAAEHVSDYAVVIGIEDYFELPDVPYARRDAAVFGDLMTYTRRIPQDRIRLLNGKANREQILKAVTEAGAATGPGGTVWVYYAGHGAADPETGERVLVGVDAQADLESFTARSVRLGEITRAAGSGGAHVSLITDACFTGKGRDGMDLIPGKRLVVPAYAPVAIPMVTQWFAAEAGQVSGPLEGKKHGAFTYFTVEALRGAADGELDGQPDGTVQAYEMRAYVTRRLRTAQNFEQVPQLVATMDVPMTTGLPLAATSEATPVAAAEAPAKPATRALPKEPPARPPRPDPKKEAAASTGSKAGSLRKGTAGTAGDKTRVGGGFEVGLPTGLRGELHIPRGPVRSTGLKAFATVGLNGMSSLQPGVGALVFADWRIAESFDLETGAGFGMVGSGDPGLGAEVGLQWDPDGFLQVQLGGMFVIRSSPDFAPNISAGFVW